MRNAFLKRSICLVFSVLFLLSLTACIIIPFEYDFKDIDERNVVSVQFYDISGSDYDNENAVKSSEPFYDLPEELNEEFINKLKSIKFESVIVIALAAIDPSFNFGNHVIRINFDDGSYKLMSDRGYNVLLDKDGELIEDDHFSCEDDLWFDLLWTYIGDKACVVNYDDITTLLTHNNFELFTDIIMRSKKLATVPDVLFPDDDYISYREENYYIANGLEPIIRVGNEYYSITEDDLEALCKMMTDTVLYWRYEDINEKYGEEFNN